MKKILFSLYHHLPDKLKRLVRLYTKSYNDVAGGGQTLFKDRIEREMKAFLKDDKSDWNAIRKDIRKCWLKFGSSPEEYFLFGFRSLNDKERATFITDYVKDMELKKRIGLDKFQNELLDKYKFYCLNKPYFKRQVLDFKEGIKESEFVDFAIRNKELFIKPKTKSRGRGAHKINVVSIEDAQKEYRLLVEEGSDWIVEGVIKQNSEIAKWNPSSVNTIRVPSFLNQDGFYIVGTVLRCGRKGAIVDNAANGGIVASVDVSTGVIISDGADEQGNTYEYHPDSNIKFKGSIIPHWDDMKKMIEEAHRTCMPSHLYIGWDVTLTDCGWVIIEGNWGQFLSQYADHKGIKDIVLKQLSISPII